jgi:hypothetical protein
MNEVKVVVAGETELIEAVVAGRIRMNEATFKQNGHRHTGAGTNTHVTHPFLFLPLCYLACRSQAQQLCVGAFVRAVD